MEVIAATKAAVDVPFTTSSRGFWLYGEGFQALHNERAFVKFTPASNSQVLTNESGDIFVSQYPNLVYVDAPAGTYLMCKTATQNAAACGILEE